MTTNIHLEFSYLLFLSLINSAFSSAVIIGGSESGWMFLLLNPLLYNIYARSRTAKATQYTMVTIIEIIGWLIPIEPKYTAINSSVFTTRRYASLLASGVIGFL